MAIDVLAIDLDNTLYPVTPEQHAGWEERVVASYVRRFGLSEVAALALAARHFEEYGLTLTGLLHEGYDVDPHEYLDEVFACPFVARLTPDPVLDATLGAIPQPKVLFTNSHDRYAESVLDRLGVRHHFRDILDITRMGFRGKPDAHAFRTLLSRLALPATNVLFVDDQPKNLAAARTIGLRTIGVGEAALEEVADVAIATAHELRNALDQFTRGEPVEVATIHQSLPLHSAQHGAPQG